MSRIDEMTDRVERLLLRHEELRRTNALLQQQLTAIRSVASDELAQMRDRLAHPWLKHRIVAFGRQVGRIDTRARALEMAKLAQLLRRHRDLAERLAGFGDRRAFRREPVAGGARVRFGIVMLPCRPARRVAPIA